MIKLAIDAGHGLANRRPGVVDPGAVAAGHREVDIVMDWALALKHIATTNGIDVYMVRKDEWTVAPVAQRAAMAARAGCTHYLSLHCNASGNPLASGTETFYRRSEPWAKTVQHCAVSAMGRRDRGLKTESQSQHARLTVLDFGGQAALLEIGFISNYKDRNRMLMRATRLAFAERLIASLAERLLAERTDR